MRRHLALTLAVGLGLVAAPAAADDPAWQTWPTGRLFGSAIDRPAPLPVRMCGLREPVCVHGSDGTRVLAALAEAERALRLFRGVARLPPPIADDGRGGGDELDLYLTGDPAYRLGIEDPAVLPVDRAPAFARIPERFSGCARDVAIDRAVATALLAAVDSGEPGGVIAGVARYLAGEASGCDAELLAAVDDAQRHPERTPLGAGEIDADDASPLLPMYLDAAFGDGGWGALLTALFYGSGQKTPLEASRYVDVGSDLLHTLDRVAKTKGKRLPDVLGDFAVARAFMGDREDGAHVPESAAFGAFGRVRFDAAFGYRDLPKRIAFTPIEPTGSVYVWIDLAGAPKDGGVALHLENEAPVTMKWAVVRVGADGQELSRIEITREPGVYVVERTVLELEGAIGLIVTGISDGGLGPSMPLRLDEAPYEPHGGTIYALVPPRAGP